MKELREKSIKLKKNFLPFRDLSVYLFILLIFNILLLNLPLTNYLGYEFSVLNSTAIILHSGVWSILFTKKNVINSESLVFLVKNFFIAALLFLILPVLVSIYSLFKEVSCPFIDGFLFYIVLTFPAPVIGIALALLSCSISKRFCIVIFFLLIILIALIPVFEIYFNPQIYFYNPLIGFFPGTIYDEGIEIDFKMISYKVMNLLFFGSIIFLTLKSFITKKLSDVKIAWMFSVSVPLAFILISPKLGYSTTYSRLQTELPKSISSEHFKIQYSEEVNDTLIKVIALHHEAYYSMLKNYFGIQPVRKISTIIFSNREQKQCLFGSANANVAKPWKPEIYFSLDNYDKTLKHEIAHCFTREFANGIFRVADNFNPVLIEGAAMAADPIYDSYDLDFMAALAYQNDFKVEIPSLFEHFNFFKQPSSLGYIVSGSFIKYLIEPYGIDKFKKLYSDLDFPKYYSKDLNSLQKEYQNYVSSKFELSSNRHDLAQYYFGRKSIFYKVCPRYVAKELLNAWTHFDKKEFEKAANTFQHLIEISGSYSATVGLAYCYEEMNQLDRAIDILLKNQSKFDGTAYHYELNFVLADMLTKNNSTIRADSLYQKLKKQNPNRILYSLSDQRLELSNVNQLKEYLFGDPEMKYNILKEINSKNTNYKTLPYLISLSGLNSIDYDSFLKLFSERFEVTDYSSCYAVYKLSLYMCEKMDFEKARKMAALTLRYSNDESFNSILYDNFNKIDWLYKNSSETLSKMKFD